MLTIYKASAGSGKTYTLAKEYILHLIAYKDKDAPGDDGRSRRYRLRPPGQGAHRSILAITFSIQATGEMKRRIVDELALLADPCGDSSYRHDFISEYGFDPERLTAVAREALQGLLFDFSFFNVSTIDSFFQGVLRSFAREIDLPGNYEVELDENMAVGIGVADMFSSLNDPERNRSELMGWISKFMQANIDDGVQFNIFNRRSSFHSRLVRNLTSLMDEDYHDNAEAIHRYFTDDPTRLSRLEEALNKRIQVLRHRFADNARVAVEAANDYGLGDKTINSTIRLRMDRWAAGKFYDAADARSATLACVLPEQVKKRYTSAFLKSNEPPRAVDDAIVAMLTEAPRLYSKVNEARLILNNLYLFGLLGYLVEFISAYRRDNNTILISDTNELLRRIIKSELTPFIYERMGVFLKHFLIDEFQDTSRMQWDNLRPLLLESLSNSHDNLIIGDEKQCIYRFRNSDPNLLAAKVRSQVGDMLSHSLTVERGVRIEENTNRRSCANVVKFNNTLFPLLAADLGAEDTYSNTIQQVWDKKKAYPGYVNIEVSDATKQEDFTSVTLDRLAWEVRRQMRAGYRPKDIAVIVRYHHEGESVINHLLKLMDGDDPFFDSRFEITSREAMLISSSPLVKLIISVLRLVDTPEASSSTRTTSAMRLAQLTTRFEYFYNREGLDATAALERALADESGQIDRLTRESVSMQLVNLHSIVEHVIGTFISKEQRDDQNIFLSAFQDLVIDYCSRGQADVHSFLQWWDSRGRYEKLATPDDLDALTVITIHASKGLQYKCVHVPFATWDMCRPSSRNRQSFSWYRLPHYDGIDDELMPPLMPLENSAVLTDTEMAPHYERIMQEQRVDNLNLFYVATTRAVEELMITTYLSSRGNQSLGYYLVNALPRLRADDPALTVDVDFDGASASIGEPLTLDGKSRREHSGGQSSCNLTATLPMPIYDTTIRHNVWSLTRIDDLCDVDHARERGTFLHDVLSHVRRRRDLPLAMRRRAHRVGLSAEQESQFLGMLTRALDDSRVDRWFDDSRRVLNERTIDLDSTSQARPDRIVWTDDDHIEVVDYKFGEHQNKYFAQVRGYIRHLSAIFPAATITGYLWYPETSRIVPVPPQ